MEIYRKGTVTLVGKKHIILETNSTGYLIHTINANNFKTQQEIKLYIYDFQNDYQKSLYGFLTFKERMLFANLLKVPGIGPKTSLNIIKQGTDNVIYYIAQKDLKKLNAIPNIGFKNAKQIIFHLGEKFNKYRTNKTNNSGEKLLNPQEIISPLKTLGFNKKQIDFAISKIRPSSNLDKMIEKAIVLISHEQLT